MSDILNLPSSWTYASFSDVADVNPRSFCPLPSAIDLPVHFVPMSAVTEEFGGIDVSTKRPLGEVRKGYTSFLANDVLLAKITPCMENGKLALVPHLPNHIAYGSTEFHVLRANDRIQPTWLAHFLSQSRFRRLARQHMTGSAGQLRVASVWLSGAQIPLAPADEQIRIVEKLEELLSELDAGVAELKAAQKKLGQYRQSLLKAAVEGSLTEQWRKQNTPKETGAQLLERILLERRARWEAKQLAKFKEQGKMPPKDWQKKYPEPIHPKKVNLPDLPPGWVWGTLSQVGWLDRGRSTHRPRNAPHLYGGQYPFVQTGDIRHAETFISNVAATYNEVGLNQSRLWPIGTICITIAANIGKTAILSSKACFPDSIVGFLTELTDVSIRYVEYFMRSVQQKLEDDAPATAQKNINLEILSKVIVAIPPIDEQNQIVKFLDHALAQAADNNFAIDLGIKQSAAQRQNILRAAFSGQLVPQDPNDEPASVLLARIRAERAAREAVKKPQGRKASV